VKFSFIHAEKAHFPVAALCRVLGVSRQGYYAHVARGPSDRVQRDAELQERVRAVHDGSKQRYGSPRVLAELKREGFAASKRRVERAMRSMGLSARAPRRFRITTTANERHLVAPNRLARDFTASRPNERWVTDISYVWTNEGWAYVAVILDLFSRAVVGWALDTTLSTRLPKDALEMALARRNAGEGLLHHSDRGCQYTSHEYRDVLDPLGITVSMSRKGNCWDGEGNSLGKGNRQSTCAVGSFPAGDSAQGVKDLSGNVWEWTESCKDSSCSARVNRGGSWDLDVPSYVRAAFRFRRDPSFRGSIIGFRCARSN
jgi:hypothetical protein